MDPGMYDVGERLSAKHEGIFANRGLSTMIFFTLMLTSLVNVIMYQTLPSGSQELKYRKMAGGETGVSGWWDNKFGQHGPWQSANMVLNIFLIVWSILKLYAINQYYSRLAAAHEGEQHVAPGAHAGKKIATTIGNIFRSKMKATLFLVTLFVNSFLNIALYQALPKDYTTCMKSLLNAKSQKCQQVGTNPVTYNCSGGFSALGDSDTRAGECRVKGFLGGSFTRSSIVATANFWMQFVILGGSFYYLQQYYTTRQE